jgi:hypothetical protein
VCASPSHLTVFTDFIWFGRIRRVSRASFSFSPVIKSVNRVRSASLSQLRVNRVSRILLLFLTYG